MAELRTHRELVESGETALVSVLLGLNAFYFVLPQLVLPGRQWHHDPDDVDAVIVGPNGLFLLDYKHWQGAIQVSETDPWQHVFAAGGREARENPLPHLEEKKRALEAFLADRKLEGPPVQLALIFPDRSQVEGLGPDNLLAGLPVVPLGQLAAWIQAAGHPQALSVEARQAIAEQLRPNSPRRLINQYQLTSRLSHSADKTAYLAYDTVLEQPVLIQELRYDPYEQPDKLERLRNELLREAKLTMQLKHDHIVSVTHVVPRDDCYYVVSEWIDRCVTLAELQAQRQGEPFAVEEVVAVAKALATALAYAHQQGIVHRDVRPENILTAPNGVVKIANFGLAKKADMGTRSTFDLRQMAQENPYVAPEFRLGQAGHHHVDQRADVFSLGVIMYQLLTGRLPHHMDEKYYEAPSSYQAGIPEALDAVVEKALRFDPAQRYSTMAALATRLAEWEKGASAEPSRYIARKLVKRTRNSLVYQAMDSKLQRPVALKKLLFDAKLTGPERQAQLQLLLREAQLASSLVHPHIVSVIDHFIEDGDGYIVMEWLSGPTLRDMLESRAELPLSAVRQLAQQIGGALQYAHSQGVVHRDVKPENVIYHEGQATVLDFGIAHATGQAPADIQKTAGTARYMAPEVLIGGEIDVRADVFSLAVVLYELLTRQYPYEASVILARYNLRLLQTPPPASGFNLDCAPGLDAVLARGLEVEPDKRYATIAEFVAAFLSPGGQTRGTPKPGDTASLPGWRALWGFGALAFASCVGIGFYGAHWRPSAATDAAPSPLLAQISASSVLTPSAPPNPTPLPSGTPLAQAVSWASAPTTIDNVTVQIEKIASQAGRSLITLSIDNQSQDILSFFTRSDRPDLFQFSDDHGHDYAGLLDRGSIDPQLLLVQPKSRVSGSFQLKSLIDPAASVLDIHLKEFGGKGRQFPLKTVKFIGGAD